MKEGKKTATSRTKKYGEVGDYFNIDGWWFQLTGVDKRSLHDVVTFHLGEEGARNRQEFIEIWNTIHPKRGFVGSDEVWFHAFKELTPEEVEELDA